jgi:hypothetical protein
MSKLNSRPDVIRDIETMQWDALLDAKYPINSNPFFDVTSQDIDPLRDSEVPNRTYTTTWSPSDTLSNWLKKAKDPLNGICYNKKSVSYNVNKGFFRCDEFESIIKQNKPALIVLGCSFTFGTGLPEHETWPVILSNLIREKTGEDIAIVNLGSAGTGYDQVDRLSNYIHLFKNTKYLCCFFPPLIRKTFVKPDGSIESILLNPFGKSRAQPTSDFMLQQYALKIPTTLEYQQKIVDKKLESISKLINIPYARLFSDDLRDNYFSSDEEQLTYANKHGIHLLTDVARDGEHPGNKFQMQLAYYMSEMLFNE